MPNIGGLVSAGLGLAGGLFGRSPEGLTTRDIDAARRRTQGNFTFNPNANDPALRLQQARANQLYQTRRGNAINEIGRGGLLGSSIALKSLGQQDTDYARELEGIQDQNLMTQRNEQLGLYRDDQDYRQRLEQMRLQSLIGARGNEASARSGAIGGLGSLAGEFFAGPRTPSSGTRDSYRYWDPNQPWLGGT